MSKKIIGKGVLGACKPRKEVLEGELDDAIFAADFGQLIDGGAPKVYGQAETFFRNTEPTPDLKAVCTAVFKALADKKHEIFDEDLQSLMSDDSSEPQEHFRLVSSAFHSETGETPCARVTLSVDGREQKVESCGSGPVDAAFKAIEIIADSGAQLLLYSVNAITTGTDAQGEVTVRLSKDGRVVNGQGADTDIIVASAKAYLNALNKLQGSTERLNPQV